jgi:hypothetical protein
LYVFEQGLLFISFTKFESVLLFSDIIIYHR